jgi:hypothetical protein
VLVELAEVALCHFDGLLRVLRITAAHRVEATTAAVFVAHSPIVMVWISVDELPADRRANDIVCMPPGTSGQVIRFGGALLFPTMFTGFEARP